MTAVAGHGYSYNRTEILSHNNTVRHPHQPGMCSETDPRLHASERWNNAEYPRETVTAFHGEFNLPTLSRHLSAEAFLGSFL